MQRTLQTLHVGSYAANRLHYSNQLFFMSQTEGEDVEHSLTEPFLDSLDPYSHQVAQALFDAVPRLIAYAKRDQSPGAPDGTLLIRMPLPKPSRDQGLYIATDLGEVAVGFRGCYIHFTNHDHSEAPDKHIQRAVTYVSDLLEDRIVIKRWYRNGILCGSSLDTPDQLPPASKHGTTTVEMISWSGKHDQTVVIPAAHHETPYQ